MVHVSGFPRPWQPPEASDSLFRRAHRLACEPRRLPILSQPLGTSLSQLRAVRARLSTKSLVTHPTHCGSSDCLMALTDRYYRRMDGWVLCPSCFSRRSR